MSSQRPRPTTNPYITQLFEHLDRTAEVDVRPFSWRQALLGSYDVLHVQWPEVLMGGRTPARRRLNELRYLCLLERLRWRRIPLVRTAHNLAPHEDRGRAVRWLDRLTQRRAAVVIRLNEHTPVRAGEPVTIPHGHYRDWFAGYATDVVARPRRLLYFGLIRPYKGVEQLLDLMEEDPGADIELRIVGASTDDALAARVHQAAAADPRVSCELSYVDDRTLAREITSASVVVLPYRQMHNSGALLLALSLDRPVLVPSNPVTDDLAREVGDRWVLRYPDSLTMAELRSAVVRGSAPGRPARLGSRSPPGTR